MQNPDLLAIGDADVARLFRACADNIAQLLWANVACEANVAAGSLVFANASFWHYTGLASESTDTAAISGILHPDDLAMYQNACDTCLENGTTCEERIRLRRHDDVYRLRLTRFVPTRNDNGDITHWLTLATDVADAAPAPATETPGT